VSCHTSVMSITPPVSCHTSVMNITPPVSCHTSVMSITPPVSSHTSVMSITPPVSCHTSVMSITTGECHVTPVSWASHRVSVKWLNLLLLQTTDTDNNKWRRYAVISLDCWHLMLSISSKTIQLLWYAQPIKWYQG